MNGELSVTFPAQVRQRFHDCIWKPMIDTRSGNNLVYSKSYVQAIERHLKASSGTSALWPPVHLRFQEWNIRR